MSDQAYRHGTPAESRLAMADEVWRDVRGELARAWRKFPRLQSSAHEGVSVLREEFEELWDDVKHDNPDGQRKEAVQVAAMAVRFLVDLFLARASHAAECEEAEIAASELDGQARAPGDKP